MNVVKLRMKEEHDEEKEKKLRIWDPASENQMRVQIMGDPNLIVNRLNGKSKINNQRFRAMVQKAQNLMNKTDIRPTKCHLNMFQHVYRDWNEEADHLTQVAREKGATWNSFMMEEGIVWMR